jgi:uncharacterized protein (DUF2141 family)
MGVAMTFHFKARAVLLTALSLLFPIAADAAAASRLTVNINGLNSRQGQVCLNLFANGDGFPTQGATKQQCVALSDRPVQVSFSNLAPGKYAVAVLHDANGDGQANQNFLGIPTEGFGFSGNPTIRIGPPSFSETAVNVSGSATIQIQMRYLF